ncbi:MAG: SusE domain-containing protein [Bacteroidota bacterium]
MKRVIPALLLIIGVVAIANAQLTKNFSIVSVANNATVNLEGDKETKLYLTWTNADLKQPGAVIRYSVQLDTVGGDFSNPVLIIGSTCCASFFDDSTINIKYGYLAGELEAAIKNKLQKTFKIGETATFDWIVMVNATGPNATYENRQTTSQRITFNRGQFGSEYVPVKLAMPLDNSSFFVEDNASINLKFQWNKAYCPAGCASPQYYIQFDNMSGDFSTPLYSFAIPQSPFDTLFDLRQDILAQMMYDDGMPVNTPKTYKWAVKVTGNNEEFITPSRRISLQRGLMRYEHVPFGTVFPIDNSVFTISGKQTDTVFFAWNRTRSGFPDAASYTILFDTAKTGFNFQKPVFRLSTAVGDTSLKAKYITLRDSLDKRYGKNWKNVKLKWTVEADITGYKFMSEDTNDITLSRGFFNSISSGENELSLINIYPNPATSEVTISCSSGISTVSVFDLTGRQVLVSGSETLTISELENGVYMVLALDKNGVSLPPQRFLKQ